MPRSGPGSPVRGVTGSASTPKGRSNPTRQHSASDHPGCQKDREDHSKQHPPREPRVGCGVGLGQGYIELGQCPRDIIVRLRSGHGGLRERGRPGGQPRLEETPTVGGNTKAPLLMLRCTNYAAAHNMTSSKGFYARMAAMHRQAGPRRARVTRP